MVSSKGPVDLLEKNLYYIEILETKKQFANNLYLEKLLQTIIVYFG